MHFLGNCVLIALGAGTGYLVVYMAQEPQESREWVGLLIYAVIAVGFFVAVAKRGLFVNRKERWRKQQEEMREFFRERKEALKDLELERRRNRDQNEAEELQKYSRDLEARIQAAEKETAYKRWMEAMLGVKHWHEQYDPIRRRR